MGCRGGQEKMWGWPREWARGVAALSSVRVATRRAESWHFPTDFSYPTPVPQQQCPAHWAHCRGDANANLATMGGDTQGSHGPQLPATTKCFPAGGKILGAAMGPVLAQLWPLGCAHRERPPQTLHGKTLSSAKAKGTSQPVNTSSAHQGCWVWCLNSVQADSGGSQGGALKTGALPRQGE